MNHQEKDDLYDKIDSDDEMTDQEKREEYFASIEEQEGREEFEHHGR